MFYRSGDREGVGRVCLSCPGRERPGGRGWTDDIIVIVSQAPCHVRNQPRPWKPGSRKTIYGHESPLIDEFFHC